MTLKILKTIDICKFLYYNPYKDFDGESSDSRRAQRVGYGVSRRKELFVKITPELPPEQSRVGREFSRKGTHIDGYVEISKYYIIPISSRNGIFYFWRFYERALH